MNRYHFNICGKTIYKLWIISNSTNMLLLYQTVLVPTHSCAIQNATRLWVRFPLIEIKYLIFSFPRSGNETKRDVDKLRSNLMGMKCLNIRFPGSLCLSCYVGYRVNLKIGRGCVMDTAVCCAWIRLCNGLYFLNYIFIYVSIYIKGLVLTDWGKTHAEP